MQGSHDGVPFLPPGVAAHQKDPVLQPARVVHAVPECSVFTELEIVPRLVAYDFTLRGVVPVSVVSHGEIRRRDDERPPRTAIPPCEKRLQRRAS